jgi:hypothetical protein
MIGDTSLQSLALRQVTGDFVSKIADWRWYGTLTFKDYVHPAKALGALKFWSRWVARGHVHGHVWLAYAMEQTRGAGVWHFHVLLGARTPDDTLVLSAARAERQWRATSLEGGFTRIDPFKPEVGAPYYLTKTASYDVGVVCPRPSACKRGRCLDGPPPW